MINSRCDAFKAWSGPLFKSIEEELYQQPEFVKHDTPDQRRVKVKQLRSTGVRYYATDYTAFESHFIPELMDSCECELYRWSLGVALTQSFYVVSLRGSIE